MMGSAADQRLRLAGSGSDSAADIMRRTAFSAAAATALRRLSEGKSICAA